MSTFAGSPALWLSRSQLNFLLTNLTQVRLFRFVSLGSSLSAVSCAFASSAFVSLALTSCFVRLTQPPESIRRFAALSRSLMQPSWAERASETQRGSLWQVTVTQCWEQERGRGSGGTLKILTHIQLHRIALSAACARLRPLTVG